jgi:hypothetical protein
MLLILCLYFLDNPRITQVIGMCCIIYCSAYVQKSTQESVSYY